MHRWILPAAMALLACCSGASATTPASPTPVTNPPPQPPGSPPAGPPTLTITPAGITPAEVTIAVGGSVRFVNDDTRPHDLVGGLDPTKPECPEIATAGFLSAGQSREAGPFPIARDCDFHDHAFLGVPGFTGKIVIR